MTIEPIVLTRQPMQREPTALWKSIVAVAMTTLIGVSATYFAPVEIGAIMDHLHLSAAFSGAIVTAELAFVAITSLSAAAWLSRVRLRHVAIVACLLVAASDFASVFLTGNVHLLLASRALAGVGGGLAFGISCIWTARSVQPARVYGAAVIIVSAVTSLVMFQLSTIASTYGLSAVFAVIAGVTLAATVPLFWVQAPEYEMAHEASVSHDAGVDRVARVGFYCAVVLANLSLSVIWQFAERLGHQYGFSAVQIGEVLSASTVGGVIGSTVSAVVGDRRGYSIPLLLTMMVAFSCGVLVSATNRYGFYSTGVALSECDYLLVMPFLLGFASWLDSTGKAAALAGGLSLSASALSPVAGGYVVDLLSPRASGWTCALLAVMAMTALLPITIAERRLRKPH